MLTGTPTCRARAAASSGVTVAVRGLELSAELQAPLTGAPFLARGILQVGYRFELARRKPRRYRRAGKGTR